MNDSDDVFFALMSDAGLTAMPGDDGPLVAGDVLPVPVEQSGCDESVCDDPGVEAIALGYWDARVCPSSEWRSVRVMCLDRTPELAAILDRGPGTGFEATWWWACDGAGESCRVLNCTLSTSDVFGERVRFTVRIALLPMLVEAFASVPVVGLSLVDDDCDSTETTLSWFVENDLDMWADALQVPGDESDGDAATR